MKLPIPLTLITGFLGSGKTTLLKALLAAPGMANTAVVVNEFGEVGLDDAILAEAGDETILLPSGCVCCAVKGDLVKALTGLHADVLAGRIPELARVALETTGLADPAPIVQTLISDRDLFRVYRLDGIVATVDAEHGLGQLGQHYEPAKQIAIADRIVVTKTDLADAGTVGRLEARVRELNPAARILRVVKGAVAPSELFALDAHEIRHGRTDAERWLAAERYAAGGPSSACHDPACTDPDHHHHGHGHLHGITSFAITFDRPLDAVRFERSIEMLRRTSGERMLRMKGIVDVAAHDRPFVVHGVQHTFYPVEMLERWPGAERRSRLVFITRGLGEDAVRAALAGVEA